MKKTESTTTQNRKTRRRRIAAGMLVAVMPLGALACGNESATGSDAAESSDRAATQNGDGTGDDFPDGGFPGGGMNLEAIQEWTACLAENGVELEMPAGRGPGADGERPEMPEGGELPEPPADGERPEMPEGGAPFGLDTSDPEVAAAVSACEDLQPQMGGRPGGPGAGGAGAGGAGAGEPEASTES